MKKQGLVIADASCWGCKACVVACKQENHTPEGIQIISVLDDGPKLVDGKLEFSFRVNICRHCEDAPCVEACPDDAIFQREDSIVVMDYDKCTGCRLCIEACPYEVISYDDEKGIAQKCNLCHHRVDQGLLPACADNVCLAHCIHFGNPDGITHMKVEKRGGQ